MNETNLYYPSGHLYSRKTSAREEFFYETGQIKTSIPKKEGKIDGEVRLYWPNGQLKRLSYFHQGKRVLPDEFYDSRGKELETKKKLEDPRDLLMKKSPSLFLLSSSWGKAPLHKETLSRFDPANAEMIYIYGLGGGAIYERIEGWLKLDRNKRIVFLEDDTSFLGSWLEALPTRKFLENPQVELRVFSSLEELQDLPKEFPYRRIDCYKAPSKPNGLFRKMKEGLLRQTTLAYAERIDRLHGDQVFANFLANLSHLPESFYANKLKNRFQGVPAIVCGAGPSLQEQIGQLHSLQHQALLIAGGSAIAALSSQGLCPHFGLVIDPNREEFLRMKNSFAFEMPLLFSTRVHPSVFATANGPFGYLRSGIGGMLELWIEEELNLLEPFIGEDLSPESISVTAITTAWALFLGCNPIIFAGVDLAYTDDKRYAPGVIEEEVPITTFSQERSAADQLCTKPNGKKEKVQTAIRWIMEKESLSYLAKKNRHTSFYNSSNRGLPIPKVPHLGLEELLLGKPSLPLTEEVQTAVSEASFPLGTKEHIEAKCLELKESLERVIDHLEILSEKKKGIRALAEIELAEELAKDLLFYDVEQLFPKEELWNRWLQLAQKYHRCFSKQGSDSSPIDRSDDETKCT